MSSAHEAKQEKEKQEFHERLLFLLKHGDLKGAADHLNENRRFEITSEDYLPDQAYDKLSPVEIAIKFGDYDLYDACNRFGGYQTLKNNRGFSIEYWALLHNFKLPSPLPRTYHHGYKNISYQGTSFDDLYLACSNGHLHVLDKLVKNSKKSHDMEFTTSKRNLYEIAALFNRAEILKALIEMSILKANQSIWTHRCDMGNVLHIAARLGHVTIAKVVIDLLEPTSEFLEERDEFEHTAMSLAVQHLHAPVVEVLARAGATMKGEFGYKKESLFDIIFSSDVEMRQEYLVKDKTVRDRIILLLAQHNPEALETLSKERLAYIEDVKQRQANHNISQDVDEEMNVDEDTVLPLGPEDDDEEVVQKIEAQSSPSGKKKLPECTLCDKKFTSEISLQAHLKSKGHVKQEKKDRLQKKFEVVTPEKTVKKQQEMIGLIERLPLLSELINLIIIKLDKWSLLKFSATSKSIQMLVEKRNFVWRSVQLWMTSQLWEKTKGKIFEPVKRVMPMVEKIRYRSTNSSWDLKDEYLSTIFDIPKYCPNLRELDVRDINPAIPVSFLSALFQHCPKLRVLKLADVLVWKSSKKEAVAKGELDAPEEEQPEPAVNPKKPWKKKKVKKTKRPDPKAWAVRVDEVLQNTSTSLEELTLLMPFPDNLPPDSYAKIIVGILKKCPNLVQLRLEATNVDNVQSSTMKFIADAVLESLPKLKKLKLMGEWLFGRLPATEYNELFLKFNKLEKLQLEGSEIANFDRDIHDALGEATHLKELVICHNGEINIDGPRIGLSNLTNLTKLGFYAWTAPSTDNWDLLLHTITARCTKIQHLETAIAWNERLGQGLTPIAPKLKVFKQKYWHPAVENPPYSMLVKCANLTLIHAEKVSLSDFHTIIDHCKFLETIHINIVPATVEENPDDNNNNNAANNNNNDNAAQPADGANANNNNENNNNNDENQNQANNNENNPVQNNGANENNNEANNNNDNAAAPENNNDNANNNNNNNAPIVAPAAPAWNVIDMGRLFEKCRHLKNLHLIGPINNKSFTNFVVSTSLKYLNQLSTETRAVSDMVMFYLAECCPNLKFCELDYEFLVSEWIELPLTRRLPHLTRFEMRNSYTIDQAFTNANKERAAKIKYNL